MRKQEFVFHGYTLRPPDSSGGFLLGIAAGNYYRADNYK